MDTCFFTGNGIDLLAGMMNMRESRANGMSC